MYVPDHGGVFEVDTYVDICRQNWFSWLGT